MKSWNYTHALVILPCLFSLSLGCAYGYDNDLNVALQNARNACSGISDSMHDMKVKAGINTAVTAVGTVTSTVALGAGIAKAKTDREISQELLDMAKQKVQQDEISFDNIEEVERWYDDFVKNIPEPDKKKLKELNSKSKTLGNVRTGMLATSTVTNIAGTAIAATNKVSDDLEENIQKCIEAVKELSNSRLAAKMEQTATDAELAQADRIVNGCRDYEMLDLKPINKRAVGAAVSSGIGAGVGFVGTITSAVANTDATRNAATTVDGMKKEHNLNAASNVMAGASTAATATATIFNATQISAIKKAAAVADACEEALK